ncbi:MAG: formylglycine-generating enzyme family protein [Magnetococcus sp. DMHC-1]
MERVSWIEAQEFIRQLNAQSDGKYRLPTEAEWKYACRSGGHDERYAGGADLASVAWYDDNSASTTHKVGIKQANGLGLYDMTGNVREWVQDWYDETAYAHHVRHDPVIRVGKKMVQRGGSYGESSNRLLRCVYRASKDPVNESYTRDGIRLARMP